MTKEQLVQRKIIKYLEARGAYVVKVVTANRAGIPDILACYKGRFIAIEVKRPETKGNVSELQIYNIKKVKEAGGISFVAWDETMAKRVLDEHFGAEEEGEADVD